AGIPLSIGERLMAFNTINITPAIASTATLHVGIGVADAMDDTSPLILTLTMTENNFGLSYGVPQRFSVASGAVVTNLQNNQLVSFASGDPNASTPQRLTNFYTAAQDLVKSLKNAAQINVAPKQ